MTSSKIFSQRPLRQSALIRQRASAALFSKTDIAVILLASGMLSKKQSFAHIAVTAKIQSIVCGRFNALHALLHNTNTVLMKEAQRLDSIKKDGI